LFLQQLEDRNQPTVLGLSLPFSTDAFGHSAALLSTTERESVTNMSALGAFSGTAGGQSTVLQISEVVPVLNVNIIPTSRGPLVFEQLGFEQLNFTIDLPIAPITTVPVSPPSAGDVTTIDYGAASQPLTPRATTPPPAATTPVQTPSTSVTAGEPGVVITGPTTPTGTNPVVTPTVPANVPNAVPVGNFGRGSTAFVLMQAPQVLTGGPNGGGGENSLPAAIVPPGGAAVPPAAAGPNGASGGDAATPAPATMKPAVVPDAAGIQTETATAEKPAEAPAKVTKLEGWLAVAAAAGYGLWHWRRRKLAAAGTEREAVQLTGTQSV
jgi:hypothetical protein